MNQKKGLIIGGDSHLGKALISRLEKDGWDIWSTTRRSELATNKSLFLNLLRPEMSGWPKDFDVIWFLAAQTSQAACMANPEQSHVMNVESPIQMMTAFGKTDAHIIFPSTSLVFSGHKPFSTINDPVSPVGIYAEHKNKVEESLLSSSIKRKTIIRISKVLDKNTILVQKWIHSLQQGKVIYPLEDLNFSPISLTKAVEVLVQIALQRADGILQISSSEQCSYADFSYFLAKYLGLDTGLIEPKTTKYLGLTNIYCPLHSTLDSSLVKENLGIPISTIAQTIQEILE